MVFPVKERGFGCLLGNGGGAAGQAFLFQIVLDRLPDSLGINPFMFIEIGILGQDHGPFHLCRYAGQRCPVAVLRSHHKRMLLSLPVPDRDGHVQLPVRQHGNRRQQCK